jgi:two-component system, OmpR family, response regulator VicR
VSGPQRILVVDDEPNIREVVELYLRRAGYAVEVAADGEQALAAIRQQLPELVVLDLMLPKRSGEEIARILRNEYGIPIIMLTAKGAEADEIAGLELGADDYVSKPFSPRKLVARVKAVLRRASTAGQPLADPRATPVRHGDLIIDPASREVRVRDALVNLTAKEFDLLWVLANHPGQAFTRDQLLDKVWGYDFFGDASTVTVHVRRLREKIEADPTDPGFVLTVWGVGYKFTASGD